MYLVEEQVRVLHAFADRAFNNLCAREKLMSLSNAVKELVMAEMMLASALFAWDDEHAGTSKAKPFSPTAVFSPDEHAWVGIDFATNLANTCMLALGQSEEAQCAMRGSSPAPRASRPRCIAGRDQRARCARLTCFAIASGRRSRDRRARLAGARDQYARLTVARDQRARCTPGCDQRARLTGARYTRLAAGPSQRSAACRTGGTRSGTSPTRQGVPARAALSRRMRQPPRRRRLSR